MRTSVDNKTMSINFTFTPNEIRLIDTYRVKVVLWDNDPPVKKSTQYSFDVTVTNIP